MVTATTFLQRIRISRVIDFNSFTLATHTHTYASFETALIHANNIVSFKTFIHNSYIWNLCAIEIVFGNLNMFCYYHESKQQLTEQTNKKNHHNVNALSRIILLFFFSFVCVLFFRCVFVRMSIFFYPLHLFVYTYCHAFEYSFILKTSLPKTITF